MTSDRVSIRNLEFQGNHGASADERRSARRFQVDCDFWVDLSAAAKSDRLRDTINYYDACAILVELGSGPAFHLLEGLAGKMIAALQARWPGVGVELEIRKLHPPCPGNPAYTAIRLSRPA